MIFPLQELVEFKDDGQNIYEITVAASRRAYQMARVKDPEIAANQDKDVCVAARQLFTNKVKYRIENKK
jgi:DNA-directed RNA polymerase subunit omega